MECAVKWKQMTAAAAAFFLIFSSASLTGAAYEEEAYRSVRVLESKGIAYVLRGFWAKAADTAAIMAMR